jgi:hypothetical protein
MIKTRKIFVCSVFCFALIILGRFYFISSRRDSFNRELQKLSILRSETPTKFDGNSPLAGFFKSKLEACVCTVEHSTGPISMQTVVIEGVFDGHQITIRIPRDKWNSEERNSNPDISILRESAQIFYRKDSTQRLSDGRILVTHTPLTFEVDWLFAKRKETRAQGAENGVTVPR